MIKTDIDEMVELIEEYSVEYEECERLGCAECNFLENCYFVAKQIEDSNWAKSINYGGCDSEEEFWEQLLN